MTGSTGPSRCDALQFAAHKMLEQFRTLLDGPSNIKSVQLDLKITPDNLVRSALLSPMFETHQNGRPVIERYDFGEP